jgi:AraC-like DNA-binding protein
MLRRKKKVEFRYYEIPENEIVLALLGEDWIREYGNDIDSLHFHNYLEVGYCHEGNGRVTIDNQIHPYKTNMFSIIPPNMCHITNSECGTKSYWEWMYFDIEQYLSNIYKDDTAFVQRLLTRIYRRAYLLQSKDYPVLENVIQSIIREMEKKDKYYQESVKGFMQVFIVELLRLDGNEEKSKTRKQKAMQISGALDYIRENYFEDIKIVQLAAACNMSESNFRRIFEEAMCMKPVEYINMIRVQKACEFIKKSPLSMSDIAYKVGFSAASTFNRNFRKVLGTSPYQWKQSEENLEGKLLNFRISAKKGW